MTNMFNLENQVAIVTGAGSGIGRQIAIGIAEAGAAVGCFDLETSEAGINETVAKIDGAGGKALVLKGSVTQKGDLLAATAEIENRFGALSLAVNCAGIADSAPAEEMSLERWQRVIDVNLTGLFLSCQAEFKSMRRSGAIVNIASMSGSIVNRGISQVHYNSSKAAVVQLTKSLAMEWSSKGIRVNSISPGYVMTPMNARPEVANAMAQFAADTPLARMADPGELVGPAIFLLSQASSFCTGHDLIVDGGFTCW
jgi:NAD(P)-dependent dehydrogenase (short-subunit alcohol dehydrogenase family)